MSETTHTPGPWRTGRKVFRTIYCEEHGTEGRLIGVMDRREDATLVAAAPEMLAVLRRAVEALAMAVRAGTENLPDFDPEEHTLVKACRAVIAKAEGREP